MQNIFYAAIFLAEYLKAFSFRHYFIISLGAIFFIVVNISLEDIFRESRYALL